MPNYYNRPFRLSLMDLRQLRSFMAVVELGSLNRAAQKLRVAQPALSRHIALLEREVGVKLLQRHPRGSTATAAGKVLAAHAASVLETVARAKHDLAHLAQAALEPVRLGLPPTVSVLLPPSFIPTVQARFPRISLQVRDAWTGHLLELLKEGRLDYAVVCTCQADQHMVTRNLVSEQMRLISAPSVGRRGIVSWAELAGLRLALPPSPHGGRIAIEAAFETQGVSPNVVFEHEVLGVLVSAVINGDACALMSQRDAALQFGRNEYIARPIARPGIKNTLVLAMPKRSTTAELRDNILNFLADQLSLFIKQSYRIPIPRLE